MHEKIGALVSQGEHMRRIGMWYMDHTNYDMMYLISPAPRDNSTSFKDNTIPRYHAILFFKDQVRWCVVYFRAKDWHVAVPGALAYQKAIRRIFEKEEEE